MSVYPTVQMPTLEEDVAINRGIGLDPDTMEVSEAEFPNLRPWCGRLTDSEKRISAPVHFDASAPGCVV